VYPSSGGWIRELVTDVRFVDQAIGSIDTRNVCGGKRSENAAARRSR
jgi:hypothetical protein